MMFRYDFVISNSKIIASFEQDKNLRLDIVLDTLYFERTKNVINNVFKSKFNATKKGSIYLTDFSLLSIQEFEEISGITNKVKDRIILHMSKNNINFMGDKNKEVVYTRLEIKDERIKNALLRSKIYNLTQLKGKEKILPGQIKNLGIKKIPVLLSTLRQHNLI